VSKLPSLGPSLTHHLVENQRQMQRQAASSSFNRSGMSATAEGETTVDGSLIVTGDLEVSGNAAITGPLAVHGTAAFDGATTIGGNAAITGTLSLPAGIIDNEALTSPVELGNASGGSNGMAINVADTDLATATIPVPAGYSQALVFLMVTTSAVNNTASLAGLYIQAVINGTPTRLMGAIATPGNGTATLSTAKSDTLTGLSGGTISVAARVRCDNGWAANASNRAYSEAIVVFLR
jgi:hypothetical protein